MEVPKIGPIQAPLFVKVIREYVVCDRLLDLNKNMAIFRLEVRRIREILSASFVCITVKTVTIFENESQ